MVFAAAATTTGRLAVSVASMRGHAVFGRRIPAHYAKPQRRAMGGGGHGHAPEWEGVDKVVRGVFPGDHHLAMAIMGGYLGIYVIYSIKSAMTKKAPAPAATPAAIVGDAKPGHGMPSVESPEFADYIDTPDFHKEIESNEYWAALGEK